jgi:tRNA (guanine-N7-)-methyltransferase
MRPYQSFHQKPDQASSLMKERLEHSRQHFSKVLGEIGCGVGLHPLRYALEHPEHKILAWEQTKNKYASFEQRIKNHQERLQGNLEAFHGDALTDLEFFIPENYFDDLFILYPNPYPKSSDRNKRFYGMSRFIVALRALKPGGKIIWRTNMLFYAEDIVQTLAEWNEHAASEGIQIKLGDSYNFQQSEEKAWTHFEKKYLNRGETCYHREWIKM